MPLLNGKENIGKNIKELMSVGYPQKQATAIALKHADKEDPDHKWIESGSSHILKYRYNVSNKHLIVVYRNGDEYKYEITAEQYADFHNASSQGAWIWEHFRA